AVRLDERGGLGVDEGVDQLVEGLVDDGADLLRGPAAREPRHVIPGAGHLRLVGGAAEAEDQVRVGNLEDVAAGEQAALVQRPAERDRARLRDDGLVEVEEDRPAPLRGGRALGAFERRGPGGVEVIGPRAEARPERRGPGAALPVGGECRRAVDRLLWCHGASLMTRADAFTCSSGLSVAPRTLAPCRRASGSPMHAPPAATASPNGWGSAPTAGSGG